MSKARRQRTRRAPGTPAKLHVKEGMRMRRRRMEIENPTVLQTKTWQHDKRGYMRAKTVNISMAPGAHGVGADPTHVVASRIRQALRVPDARYSAGLVRRIDPKTGQVLEVLDPHTGQRVDGP